MYIIILIIHITRVCVTLGQYANHFYNYSFQTRKHRSDSEQVTAGRSDMV